MTVTLTPDIENAVAEQAQREGTTPERLVLDRLRTLFVPRRPTPDEVLGLAAQVYKGLSAQDVENVEKVALDRSHFAGDRQPS